MKDIGITANAEKAMFTPYGGGLVRSRSPRTLKPNRILQCANFEERYGEQGYGGIMGYEAFDGRAAPSAATYSVLPFTTGSAQINAGDTLTGAACGGLCVLVNLTSGSWAGGDAAGTIIVAAITGNWAAAGVIQVGGITKAIASAAAEAGSLAQGAANNQAWLTATRNLVRSFIQAVPGSGPVLGVGVYKTVVYAVRNNVAGTAAAIYQSSVNGWVLVSTGFIPGGAWKFITANFSANTTTIALFGVDGRNRLIKWDGATLTRTAPIYGSEALSTSNLAIGIGARAFVHSGTTRNYAVGDLLTAWSTADASNSMSGNVTAYNSGTSTVTINVTSITGAGTFASWELGQSDFRDKPFLLAEHRNYMMLAYPLGFLQTSNLGDPSTYTTTAANFGFGQELTGIKSFKGAYLGVFCRSKIEFLSGASSTDWSKQPYSTELGALVNTVADNGSNALFVSTGGVVNLQAVQATGYFAPSDLTRDFRDYLMSRINSIVGARLVGASNQYRIYFNDQTMLRLTMMTGDSQAVADSTSITRQKYLHVPTCFTKGVMANNTEGLFFGTADGFVMQEDVGSSFNGAAIDYFFLTTFNHYKSPDNNKRFSQIDFDITSPDPLTLSFRQLFDYDDGVWPHGGDIAASTQGTGGQFDISQFDTFLFDLPIHTQAVTPVQGIGRSMALLVGLSSDYVRPFVVHGQNTKFTVLGSSRP